MGEYKMLNCTTPFTRHRLVVRKRIRSQWSISTIICICNIAHEDYLYLYRRVCVCLCVYPSKRIHVAVCGPIGTKFGKHMHIHLEKVGKIKICPVSRKGNLGGFRGSEIGKCGKSAKWLDRLAPNLARMCGFIWEWT